MRAPAFWWKKPGLVAALLQPVGSIYGMIAASRLKQAGTRAAVPVICIGNPTVGGAGKTPTALAVAQMLIADGERPAFLTRGYGGTHRGPVWVAPQHDADEVGDEPLLLARGAPTVVARDRAAGAALAVTRDISAIVMDDGFQNPALAKDLSILVVDGRRGLGNGKIFPAGPLRAPLGDQLARAQAVLNIGEVSGAAPVAGATRARGLPLFHGRLVPDAATVAALRGHKVLAFAGIGDPDKFFATLDAVGIETVGRRSFPDHHIYTRDEINELLAEARARNLRLVTTEKDIARCGTEGESGELAAGSVALPVRLEVDESDAFRALIRAALVRRRG
jgi:tetraacyldisaccharide 4'-kinase